MALGVQADLQGFEDLIENALSTPMVEVMVNRLPGTVSLGQIPPRGPRAEDPEHAIDHLAFVPISGSCDFHGIRFGEVDTQWNALDTGIPEIVVRVRVPSPIVR